MIMSAPDQTSWAVGTIWAPARSYRSWGMAEPSPAPSWISTRWPAWVSSRAPSGVSATRNSLSLTSTGTPMSTGEPLLPRVRTPGRIPWSARSPGDEQQAGDGLGIADGAVLDRGDGVVERHPDHFDPALRRADRFIRRGGDEELDALVGEARGRVDVPERLDR